MRKPRIPVFKAGLSEFIGILPIGSGPLQITEISDSIIDDLLEHFSSDMPPINLTDIFLPLSLPAQMIFYGSNEVEPRYGVQDAGSKAVIRCNRQRLRSWLATNIHINFGSAATTLEEIPGNRVRVNFENGSSAIGDILVGADGVNSAIRQYLVQPDPVHVLPIATVVGEVVLSGKEFEKQLELGYSGYVAHDANSQDEGSGRIFVGLNSVNADGKSGNYYWSVSYIDPAASNLPHWTSYANKARRYELALEKTSHLKSEFTEIIRQTGVQGVSDIQMCLRELELQDLPTGRVTLLGDAAHCMTPCKCTILLFLFPCRANRNMQSVERVGSRPCAMLFICQRQLL